MTFNELLDKEVPKITLADFINLCLAAHDDKVRINIELLEKGSIWTYPIEQEDIRIIEPILQPYYEYQIIGFYTCENICLILKKDGEGERKNV